MNDLTQNELSLTLERRIPAPPATVYQAWLKPETLTRIINACPDMGLSKAETDPRVGGHFLLVMNNGSKDIRHTGIYLELAPHSRIRFTWQSEFSTVEGSEVILTLVPDGEATVLTLTHVRFVNAASRDGHASGWTTILDAFMATAL